MAKDISPRKDETLVKMVIEEGVGEDRPLFGDTAYVKYYAWKEDGGKVGCSEKEYSFIVGKAEVLLAWEFSIASMTQGEVAMVLCSEELAHGSEGLPPHIPQHSSLIFHLHLVHWHGQDISESKDGSLCKSVLKQGELYGGPNEGALCTVEWVGRCNGREFERREVTFEYGEGKKEEVLEWIEKGLATFSKGEKSRLVVQGHMAYGPLGRPSCGIPADCDLVFDVYLKECQRLKEFWDMSSAEKVHQSGADKLKALVYFKQGNFTTASKFFGKVVEYLQFILHEGEDEQLKINLLTSSLVNLAICQLQMDDPFQAELSCSKALEVEADMKKALFNRAQKANKQMRNFASAADDLRRLVDTNAGSSTVHKQLKEALSEMEKMKESEKTKYFGMFDK